MTQTSKKDIKSDRFLLKPIKGKRAARGYGKRFDISNRDMKKRPVARFLGNRAERYDLCVFYFPAATASVDAATANSFLMKSSCHDDLPP
jgi:hypothetical protein